MNTKISMNVDEALLLADNAHTGFSGHLEALQILAAEVRRQILAAEVRRQNGEIQARYNDSERYRYLRNREPAIVFDRFGQEAGCWIDAETDEGRLILLTGDDADAAIDAEIAKQRTPK